MFLDIKKYLPSRVSITVLYKESDNISVTAMVLVVQVG